MTQYTKKHTLSSIIFLPFLFILVCWPAVLNGSPIFFIDSLYYIESAAAAFHKIFGLEMSWDDASNDVVVRSNALQDRNLTTTKLKTGVTEDIFVPTKTQAAAVQSQPQDAPTLIAGRSIYYGAFLFVADIIGSLWLGIILQALIVILSIYMTFLVILPAPSRATFVTLIMLGMFSSLPFYVSYLMPDFLTGIVILAVANLIAFGARMQRWMILVWGLLLLLGLVSHTSHVLISGVMIVGCGLLQVIRRRTLFTLSLVVCISALGTAVVAEMAFSKVVEIMYGMAPLRPPFLMARMISNGSGYQYLVDNCDRHNLRICNFIDVLPQSTDEILWSQDPDTGVYAISNVKIKNEINDQQMEFVISVFRYDPFNQIATSFQDFIKQLFMIRLSDFIYDSKIKNYLNDNLPVEKKGNLSKTLLYKGSFPLAQADFVMVTAVILFLFYIVYSFVGILLTRKTPSANVPSTARSMINKKILIFSAIIIAGLCLNAAITGILSGPYNRYEARVIWLVSFLGMYLACLRNKRLIQLIQSDPLA